MKPMEANRNCVIIFHDVKPQPIFFYTATPGLLIHLYSKPLFLHEKKVHEPCTFLYGLLCCLVKFSQYEAQELEHCLLP